MVAVSGFSAITSNFSVRDNKVFDKFHTCQLSAEGPPKGNLRITILPPDATLGWEKELNPTRTVSQDLVPARTQSATILTPVKSQGEANTGFCSKCGVQLGSVTEPFCKMTGAKH